MFRAVDGLTFDADAHRYRFDGTPMPGVTSIIAAAGLAPSQWFTDSARTEGSYLHDAIALDHEGALDDATLDPLLRPYVDGWRWLKRELHLFPLLWEFGVCDPHAGYAGTLDLVAVLAPPTGPIEYWLIDLKRREPSIGAALQTAAYRRALVRGPLPTEAKLADLVEAIRGRMLRRGIVTWDATSLRPKLLPFDIRHSARDETRFCAALEVYRMKQEAGYLS